MRRSEERVLSNIAHFVLIRVSLRFTQYVPIALRGWYPPATVVLPELVRLEIYGSQERSKQRRCKPGNEGSSAKRTLRACATRSSLWKRFRLLLPMSGCERRNKLTA